MEIPFIHVDRYLKFFLHYHTYFAAIGCSNMVPPEDTWLRRNGNEATLGCYTSQQTWHLRCRENQWIGVIGNCTRGKFDDFLDARA